MQIWNLKRKDMLRRNLIKFGIIIRNPKLIVNLFNFDKTLFLFSIKIKICKKKSMKNTN